MIKASELRIGNRAIYKPYGNRDGNIITVCGIWGMKAYFDRHSNDSGMFFHLQPIPLTSEIIGKCKSNSQVLRYEVRLNKMVIEIDDLKVEISTPEPIDGIRESSSFAKVPIIEYLHQLQNLFFALTGQELEVKL